MQLKEGKEGKRVGEGSEPLPSESSKNKGPALIQAFQK
jgi:hypothetical protein